MSRTITQWALGVLALAFVAGCTTGPGAAPGKVTAAVAAAEAWLRLTDAGRYAESWQEAAQAFRAVVPEEQWVTSLQGVREPMGKVLSRSVRKTTYRTTLPGAPDGEYVIIQFDASFEGKKTAIETITPRLEEDGTWRVSGYFIK